ncbi:MAG TPA: TIM barrel protein [Armatimonadota bacterium]|jgi:sugar phosphate isomerase/epimerase
MKLGLHAHALLLAGGLRDYQPVGRGTLTAAQLLDKAAQLKFAAVQIARLNVSSDPISQWDMVMLVNLRRQAEELDLQLHLSTNMLLGEHLADLIRAAYTMGAVQVTVGLACLQGNVQQRQHTLEHILGDLDVAIKAAERYKVMLAIENGHHTSAADLAALVQAAQSDWVGACYDMGNALTVPENPVEAAELLAPYCKSAHMKDLQVYRSADGAILVNCPIGEGILELTDVLRALNTRQPDMPIFLQTAAERLAVPLLNDDFLQQYPRITARALAGLLRRGTLVYPDDELRFPHEQKTSEREVLKWEDDRLKRSLKQAQKLMGTQSLTLLLE